MSAFCKVTCGKRAGGTAANGRYITRESACDRWDTHNIEETKRLGVTDREQRRNVAAYLGDYADQGRGCRKDYRAVLSFPGRVDSEKAMAMAKEFIKQTPFKNCRAVLAVHQNTDNTHVHILAAARKLDGKKLDLSNDQYRRFDKTWALIHDRHLERGAAAEHDRKCHETHAYKTAFTHGLTQARPPRMAPNIQQFYTRTRAAQEQSRWQHRAAAALDRAVDRIGQIGSRIAQALKSFAAGREADGDDVGRFVGAAAQAAAAIASRAYRHGPMVDSRQWEEAREKMRAADQPARGQSPAVIRIPHIERQNLGGRFKHAEGYFILDGMKGHALNADHHGRDLFFIPNRGEVGHLADAGRREIERIKSAIERGGDCRMTREQWAKLQREGFLTERGPGTWATPGGREIRAAESGRNVDIGPGLAADKSQPGKERISDLGRGR